MRRTAAEMISLTLAARTSGANADRAAQPHAPPHPASRDIDELGPDIKRGIAGAGQEGATLETNGSDRP